MIETFSMMPGITLLCTLCQDKYNINSVTEFIFQMVFIGSRELNLGMKLQRHVLFLRQSPVANHLLIISNPLANHL